MRIALISDIHGNPLAFDAVLADIAAQGGVDRIIFNGDYAALGYDPVGALERIADLPGAVFTRGNTDRYTVSEDRPPPTPVEVLADADLLTQFVEVERNFAWTRGMITGRGGRDWFAWLTDLPLDYRLTLPDGTRLLAVHAMPGRDDGPGLTPEIDDAQLSAWVADAEADLIVVGHTHFAQDRTVPEARVINTGSVSNAPGADQRASYAVLHADADGYRVEFRRVAYDVAGALAGLDRVRHPCIDFQRMFLTGGWRPTWAE